MTLEPLIPPPLWLALAVAGAMLLAWYAWRRPSMVPLRRWVGVVALMGLAVTLALGILLNPIRVRQIPPPPGKPLLTVLVDASASMATPDAGAGSTRYGAASRVASDLATQLADTFEVRVRTFSGVTAAAEAQDLFTHRADGQNTDIAAAIADNLATDRPQGQAIALLSDGIQNVGDASGGVLDAVRRARALDAPIFTETFGGSANAIDLAVSLRQSQDLAFVGQRVPVTVRVGQVGAAGIHAIVTLLEDGKEIGRQEVAVTGESVDARFWVKQEKPGLYPYEARVEPVPGEVTQANNQATYLLRVVDDPIRVLTLEGKPYWDSKFLTRTLASVSAVELHSVVRVADGRFVERSVTRRREAAATQPAATPAAPTAAAAGDVDSDTWKVISSAAAVLSDPAKLRRYQVIVLGRDAEPFLTDDALANLQSWVSQDGGALVCYRGEPVATVKQGLAKLLPVKWTVTHESRFHVRLTEQGRDLHWFGGGGTDEQTALVGMPALASTAQADRSKPLAVVLATSIAPDGSESPAVVYQPYGTGRAVVIEGAGMWRWAFLPPQFQQREQVYSELWHSLLRWLTSGASLMPGQRMTLVADKVNFGTIEHATATLLIREEASKSVAPTVELTGPRPTDVRSAAAVPFGDQPGVFTVNFGRLPEGHYQARVGAARADEVAARTVFDVRAISQEQLDLQVRPDLMARIASDSGGGALAAHPADELAAQFREHLLKSRPPRYERTTAWDRPWLLGVVVGAWCLSWFFRRSGGLV